MNIIGQNEHVVNIVYEFDFGTGLKTDNIMIVLSNDEFYKIFDNDNDGIINAITNLINLNKNYNIVQIYEMVYYNNELQNVKWIIG